MPEVEEPRGVIFLKEALAERLGRPVATCVAKSNPSEWYIFDPCFSMIQRGVGSASRGYRSGILINSEEISFYIELAKTDEMAAKRAAEVIDAAWHLFSCVYPWESPKKPNL